MPASEALYQLLRVAKSMNPKVLDMDHWAVAPFMSPAGEPLIGHDCGTTACLMGHAANDSWFKERQVRLRWEPITDENNAIEEWQATVYINDREMDDYERSDFFGIPGTQFLAFKARGYFCDADTYLFMPTAYYATDRGTRTPLSGEDLKTKVIEHIEEVIYVCNLSEDLFNRWFEQKMKERDEFIRASKSDWDVHRNGMVSPWETVSNIDTPTQVFVTFSPSEEVADEPVKTLEPVH